MACQTRACSLGTGGVRMLPSSADVAILTHKDRRRLHRLLK